LWCRCTWNYFKERYSIKETGIFDERWCPLQDNARPYISHVTTGTSRHRWNTCKHPSYSQDLIPCDSWTFLACEHELRGQKFSANTKMKQASTLRRMPGNDLLHVYEKWVWRCKNV
jgi:hypothetical protein